MSQSVQFFGNWSIQSKVSGSLLAKLLARNRLILLGTAKRRLTPRLDTSCVLSMPPWRTASSTASPAWEAPISLVAPAVSFCRYFFMILILTVFSSDNSYTRRLADEVSHKHSNQTTAPKLFLKLILFLRHWTEQGFSQEKTNGFFCSLNFHSCPAIKAHGTHVGCK